jgi:hypothetical protein
MLTPGREHQPHRSQHNQPGGPDPADGTHPVPARRRLGRRPRCGVAAPDRRDLLDAAAHLRGRVPVQRLAAAIAQLATDARARPQLHMARRCQHIAVDRRVDHVLAAGDTLVLSGMPEALALAEEKLLRV